MWSVEFSKASCDFCTMVRDGAPQVLTANRLQPGDVVYWCCGAWVESLSAAEVLAAGDPAKNALEAANGFVAGRVIVNPYLFPVRIFGHDVQPIEERERIRAGGPSVRRDLGKQADHLPDRAKLGNSRV